MVSPGNDTGVPISDSLSARFSFAGASDDLVEYDTPEGSEEDSTEVWSCLLVAPNQEMVEVHVRYTDAGNWMVGVAPADDDNPVPPWSYTIDAEPSTSYSARLTVLAPRGTELTNRSVQS